MRPRIIVGLLPVIISACSRESVHEPLSIEVANGPFGADARAIARVNSGLIALGPQGTYYSADEGKSWVVRGGPPTSQIFLNPIEVESTPSVIFATDHNTVAISRDTGRTWYSPRMPTTWSIVSIGETLFGIRGQYVVRSRDGGFNWPDTLLHFTRSPYLVLLKNDSLLYATDGFAAARSVGGSRWESFPGPWAEKLRQDSVWMMSHPLETALSGVENGMLYLVPLWSPETIISRDSGRSWTSIPSPLSRQEWYLQMRDLTDDGSRYCLFRQLRCEWVQLPDSSMRVYKGFDDSARVLAPTNVGIFSFRGSTGPWTHLDNGIPAPVEELFTDGDIVYLSTGNAVHARDRRGSWHPVASNFAGFVKSAMADGNKIVVATDAEVALGTKSGPWTRIHFSDMPGLNPGRGGNPTFSLSIVPRSLCRIGNSYFMAVHNAIARSDDHGMSWRFITDSTFVQPTGLRCDGRWLYLAGGDRIWRSDDGGGHWTNLWDGDGITVDLFTIVRGYVFAVLTDRTIAIIDPDSPSHPWERRPANGLDRAATTLWVNPEATMVMIVGTGRGLYWSNDGAQTFHRSPVPGDSLPVTSLLFPSPSTRTGLVGTTFGLFSVKEEIPLPHTPGAAWRYLVEALRRSTATPLGRILLSAAVVLGGYLLGVIALLVLTWTRGSVVLSRSKLRRIARRLLLDAPGLGRWALFVGYRRRLIQDPRVRAAGADFFGLPLRDADNRLVPPDPTGDAMVEVLGRACDTQRAVLLVGTGGAGKTTSMARLAWLAANRKLPPEFGRSPTPVLVPAAYYDGDLLKAISDVLRERYGVGVTQETIAAQLETGDFLILFDGVSEVAAEDAEIVLRDLLRTAKNADFSRCRFFFATRPVAVEAMEDPSIQLLPLTPDVVSLLLPRYRVGAVREARVRRQLASFRSTAIAPLLFTFAIAASETESDIASRSALYERYVRGLLGVAGEGRKLTWAGWRLVLSHIAGWSMLEAGQRGVGLHHHELLSRLGSEVRVRSTTLPLSEVLTQFYGFKVDGQRPSLDVTLKLERAGVLEGGPPHRWRFAHDTFEEYFAAVRILDSIDVTGRWPDVSSWMATSERQREFLDVLVFAVELGGSAALLSSASSTVPELWLEFLGRGEDGE